MTQQTAVIAPTTWSVDPSHSAVEFSVKHMMVSTVRGRFTGVTGTIVEHPQGHGYSSVEATIHAATVDTHDERRDAHLRSQDFLDVDRFPALTFKSTRIEPRGADRLRVYGALTIRDTTREVVLDTTINGRGTTPFGTEVWGLTAETSINRKDFGLNWNVALETGGILVGETVKITLEIEAVKQS
jgi:polyisoprenoid-binding protein YceI